MANWSDLKAAIDAIITTNGNQEITGDLMNQVLDSIVDNVGANATYVGIATPSTVPGTPDGPEFYIAFDSGIYSNFNSFEFNSGSFAILSNASGSWVE